MIVFGRRDNKLTSRAFALISLVIGWLLVFFLVQAGAIESLDAVVGVGYLCTGAIAGTILNTLYPYGERITARGPESHSKRSDEGQVQSAGFDW